MSRDPDLLAAVEALDTRQPRTVELHWRVPLGRRLLATAVRWATSPRTAPTLLITFRVSPRRIGSRMRWTLWLCSHELRTLASLKGYVGDAGAAPGRSGGARALHLNTMSGSSACRAWSTIAVAEPVEMRGTCRRPARWSLGPFWPRWCKPWSRSPSKTGLQSPSPPTTARRGAGRLRRAGAGVQNLVQNAINTRSGGRVEGWCAALGPRGPLPRGRDRRQPRHRARAFCGSPSASIASAWLKAARRAARASASPSSSTSLNRHRGTLAIARRWARVDVLRFAARRPRLASARGCRCPHLSVCCAVALKRAKVGPCSGRTRALRCHWPAASRPVPKEAP